MCSGQRDQARTEPFGKVGYFVAVAGGLVRNGLNDGDEVLGAVRELTHQEGNMILPVAALRHIERHTQHGDRTAFLRADELRAAEHPADLAVGSDDAKLLVEAGGFSCVVSSNALRNAARSSGCTKLRISSGLPEN